MYITNNSIFVQWKFDPENCSKLNGFLFQFYIELKVTSVNNKINFFKPYQISGFRIRLIPF